MTCNVFGWMLNLAQSIDQLNPMALVCPSFVGKETDI